MVIYLRLRVKFLGVFFKSFAKRSQAVVSYAITAEGRLNSLRLLWALGIYSLMDWPFQCGEVPGYRLNGSNWLVLIEGS